MQSLSDSRRREAAVIAALTLVGATLRFWGSGTLGLNHFDEGIYAISGVSVLTTQGIAGIEPAFSPPGFPILVGIAYLVFGVSDQAAILVSQVAGTLTIPAIGWVGRRTFGPGAGAMAAGLAAMSGASIVFSRMALTDSTFLLCWILAMGFGGLFLERPTILRALALGLAIGVSQSVKYNGYLGGLIIAITTIGCCVLPTNDGRQVAVRALAKGLIAALIAALIYWPWYRFVQAQPGGYARLLAHQRSYLGGWNTWVPHWEVQMAQSTALSGAVYGQTNWALFAWPVALLGALYAAHGPRLSVSSSRWAAARVRLGILLGAVVLGSSPSAPWWIALVSLPWLLTDRRPTVRILGVWWLTMAILTPFYHPYARLWLPLHAAGWLVLAWFVSALGTDMPSSARFLRIRCGAIGVAVAIAMVQDLAMSPHAYPLSGLLSPTDSLRLACEGLEHSRQLAVEANVVPKRSRFRVVGRPPLIFYLGTLGGTPIAREENLDGLARNIDPGDWAVLDDAVVPGSSYMFQGGRSFNASWKRNMPPMVLRGGLAPATMLDIDPSQAYERNPMRESYLHSYVRAR